LPIPIVKQPGGTSTMSTPPKFFMTCFHWLLRLTVGNGVKARVAVNVAVAVVVTVRVKVVAGGTGVIVGGNDVATDVAVSVGVWVNDVTTFSVSFAPTVEVDVSIPLDMLVPLGVGVMVHCITLAVICAAAVCVLSSSVSVICSGEIIAAVSGRSATVLLGTCATRIVGWAAVIVKDGATLTEAVDEGASVDVDLNVGVQAPAVAV
jgi:hypothetical protein